MVLQKRTTRYDGERLLRLHDDLDELVADSGLRQRLRTGAITALAAFVGFRILQVATDVGVGVEMALVVAVSGVTIAVIQIWKRLRVRELRRRIADVEDPQNHRETA